MKKVFLLTLFFASAYLDNPYDLTNQCSADSQCAVANWSPSNNVQHCCGLRVCTSKTTQ